MLFSIADEGVTGKIDFKQYVFLFQLLTTPETEFEVAFRMFDTKKTGQISKEDFMRVISNNKYLQLPPGFDYNCGLMSNFFGRDGSSKLSFIQFSQFLQSLQEEIRKQEFLSLADPDGYITGQQFCKMVASNMSKEQLTTYHLHQNLEKFAKERSKISYAEFDAYQKILRNIDVISESIRNAASKTSDGSITLNQFKTAAQRVTGIGLSPMETKLIFQLFHSKEEGKLYKEDYEEFIKIAKEDRLRRQQVLDLWIKDDLADDGVTPLTKKQQFFDKLFLFTAKTLYGGIAGAVGATAVYPIDLVKTRMQNQREGQRLYASSRDCFQQIWKKEGPRGLYRGLVPQLIGVTPEKAIKLVVNDFLRDIFGQSDDTEHLNIALEILAGCGAGASQVIFTNPIEIVKIRLQVAGEVALLTGEKPKTAVQIVRELGFAGLYKGASACFLRDIPFSGLFFPLFGKLKQTFKEPEDKNAGPWQTLLAGTIAGAVAASSTTPIDVVKTRLQVAARKGQDTYANILDCFIKIAKNEGWKAFFKGVVPRVFRSAPQFGITLLTYEILQRNYNPKPLRKDPKTLVGNVPVSEKEMEALSNLYSEKLQKFKGLFSTTGK